jgi:secreted trypsin-like serine protease
MLFKKERFMPRPDPPSFDTEAAVRAAVEYAQKWANEDDEAFIRALNGHFENSFREATRSQGELRVVTPKSVRRSFHLYKDKRYLRNARKLAKRTLGGTRILGGRPVKPNEFVDCVAVGSDTDWACTGTLIGPNVVLTAGHCAEFATRVFFGHDVAMSGKTVAVKKRVRHPKYRRGKQNDVMVLLLEESVTVEPCELAPKPLIDKATDGRAVGFGNTDPMGAFGYGLKRAVDVPIASASCDGKVEGHDDQAAYGCDRGLEIVAGRPLLERDSCKGDSGGPFYILDKKGRWLLAGATSRATNSAMSTCGDGGIYVRVDRYRPWIASIPGVKLP